jgi:hypothetical protein
MCGFIIIPFQAAAAAGDLVEVYVESEAGAELIELRGS